MTDQWNIHRRTGACIHGYFRAHRHVRPIEGDEQACEGGRFVVAEPNYEAAITAVRKVEGGFDEWTDEQIEANLRIAFDAALGAQRE